MIGDPYATLEELKTFTNVKQATYDGLLNDALDAASRGIESCTGRQFNKVESASARVYYPEHSCLVEPDDFHTTTGLIVRTATSGGSFDTTWDAEDFEPRPLNGVVDGQSGWPFYEVWGTGGRLFPTGAHRAPVEVTAQWGWASVPLPVKQACLILAAELYKTKDAPFGIAGNDQFGAVRVRENPMVMKKLAAYVRFPVLVA